MQKNLFTTLEHYTSSPENFLTETFVYVISMLLEYDRKIGIRLINRICPDRVKFNENDNVIIATQIGTQKGRPDITISSEDRFVYVEVKRDSPLFKDQIKVYKEMVNARAVPYSGVVLLSRSLISPDGEEKPDNQIYWYEIHKWLLADITNIKSTKCVFLVNELVRYLEVTKMAINKITWEYEKGVLALNELLQMLTIAIKEADLTVSRYTSAWDSKGYYLENAQYFCGIYFEKPNIVWFEKYKDNKTLGKIEILDLGNTNFFCLNAINQVQLLKESIIKGHETLKEK